jgi:hypothetical protein
VGYRNYIAYIPRSEYDKIKDMTKEKLYKRYKTKMDDYLGVYDIAKNELYGFGKYVEFGDKKFFKNVFRNKKLNNELTEEHEFYIVGPEFLKHIIEHYTAKVKSNYTDIISPFFHKKGIKEFRDKPKEFLSSIQRQYDSGINETYKFDFTKITDEEQTALFKLIDHIRGFGNEWGVDTFINMLPYDLDKGEEVTTSWKYEYSIFELVRIYKTFDWKKNVMIYYGF